MIIKRFVSNDSFSCNVYVCTLNEVSFIIDLGYYGKNIENYLTKNNLDVKFILLTHGHFDHIGGINDFLRVHPNIKVYTYEEEIDVCFSPRKNVSTSFTPDNPYILETNLIPIYEGKNEIDKIKFDVIHTPGHTKGSVIYYFKEEKALFSGDTILGGSIGRSDLPTGSEVDLFDSLEKIKKLNLPDDINFYSGHGETYSYKIIKAINSYLK